MSILKLSCKKASYLIDKRTVAKLSFFERLQLSQHNRICDVCKAYEQQTRIIDKVIFTIKAASVPSKTLPNSLKSKIIQKLKEK